MAKEMSRAAFLKGAGALGVAAGVAVALGGCSSDQSGDQGGTSSAKVSWDYEVDVLVAGSGLGGMNAALAAAQGGAKTLIIEVNVRNGGGALISGGWMHTVLTESWNEAASRAGEMHDAKLAQIFVDTAWNEWFPWLEELGINMTRGATNAYGNNTSWQMGPTDNENLLASNAIFFDSLQTAFQDFGGEILYKTRAVSLHTDTDGNIIGVQAATWADSPTEEAQKIINIKAGKTILATGNFHGNRGLAQQYLSKNAQFIIPTAGFQYGDGLLMGLSVGASLSQYMDQFAGGINAYIPGEVVTANPDEYVSIMSDGPDAWLKEWPYHALGGALAPFTPYGVATVPMLVNRNGKRFVDENSIYGSSSHIYEQPRGYAWALGDQQNYDLDPDAERLIADIKERGGKMIQADTLDDLADQLAAEGVNKGNLQRTIAEYNAAIEAGTANISLEVPRTSSNADSLFPLSKPPFYAYKVVNNIYTNYGGLLIDENSRTLTAGKVPIGNLYSPPPCGGGVFAYNYLGGNALAGVFGYLAGKHAASRI